VGEIEKLMNVTHPSIAIPFRFLLPTASKELKMARLYTRSGSRKDVLSARPLWWVLTAKAIAVGGIMLGMKFLHSFGLIHGGLKPSSALFDDYHRVQIADFGRRYLICVKVPRLRADLRQSLRRLRYCPVKSALRRSMSSRLH
jgi:serine/threonine protein kinase